MKPEHTGLPEDLASRPKFQQLQYQFAAHLRDPQTVPYDNPAVRSEAPIEARRLKVYESLFFNNLSSFLGGLFPITQARLGESAWQEMIRDFMRLHHAQTPLFHEMGEEFLLFLRESNQSEALGVPWLFELAHFEWVELALMIEEQAGFGHLAPERFDASRRYRLSPLAWLLAYEWPVHRMSADASVLQKPDRATTLLAYRNVLKPQEPVEFMELSPALFQLLQFINEADGGRSVEAWLAVQHDSSGAEASEMEARVAEALQPLLDLHLLASGK